MPARLPPVETVLYVARPGLGALPAGTGTVILFLFMQSAALVVFLWAIWWPQPRTTGGWTFAVLSSTALGGAALLIAADLIRRSEGAARGIVLAPFIRLTVTDRRVVWTLPWAAEPLLEIGLARIRGGLLGDTDRRGRGNAAMMLAPGDPAADDAGFIHFDRLPDADRFVAALGGR